MKLIIAYINPFKLEDVRDAVQGAGVTGMSVSSIEGFGRQIGHTETYRGTEYDVAFAPKMRVEVLVSDELTQATVSAIEQAARTGAIGDGKIAILSVDDVVRIRTGERGSEAL